MKKVNYLLFSFLILFVGIGCCFAAPSYSLSVSSSSIQDGGKVTATVTVKNTAAWNVKITSAGNTNGCTNSWADATSNGNNATKSFSVTCKASSVGRISFILSGDITSSDGSNTGISGTKTVNVTEKLPDSTINTLKSIKVDDYELSPTFSSDTLEYTVTVPPTTTKVNISAERTDSKSSVSGTGEVEVVEGTNRFELVVTAESGATKTYIVNVNVEDSNPINVDINGETYTLLKTSRSISIPTLFTESTIEIDGNTIPCFINEENGLTLIAAKDSLGDVSFFIYKEGIYSKYIELVGNNNIVYPISKEINIKGFSKTTCKINDEDVDCYKYDKLDNGYYLLYGMDLETGEEELYIYDSGNNNFQVFDYDLFNTINSDNEIYLYLLLGSIGIIVLCFIIIISLSISKHKIKKSILAFEEKLKNGHHVHVLEDKVETKDEVDDVEDNVIDEDNVVSEEEIKDLEEEIESIKEDLDDVMNPNGGIEDKDVNN